MLIDNIKANELAAVVRGQRQLQAASPLGNSSVSKGALRIRSTEGLLVEGSQKVTGSSAVTGTQTVSGTHNVSGTERITGTWYLDGVGYVTGTLNVSGNQVVSGSLTVNGPLTVAGATALNNVLTLGGSGRIVLGAITLDPVGSGGQITSSGFLRLTSVNGIQVIGNGTVSGNWLVSGTKLFSMPHPTKGGYRLQHGSTESPVSGIEYWGEGVIASTGKASVTLPAYFESLAKPAGRSVFVTGRGFAADWDDINAGKFAVRGVAAKKFSWLVKAERFGGDFAVELLDGWSEEP